MVGQKQTKNKKKKRNGKLIFFSLLVGVVIVSIVIFQFMNSTIYYTTPAAVVSYRPTDENRYIDAYPVYVYPSDWKIIYYKKLVLSAKITARDLVIVSPNDEQADNFALTVTLSDENTDTVLMESFFDGEDARRLQAVEKTIENSDYYQVFNYALNYGSLQIDHIYLFKMEVTTSTGINKTLYLRFWCQEELEDPYGTAPTTNTPHPVTTPTTPTGSSTGEGVLASKYLIPIIIGGSIGFIFIVLVIAGAIIRYRRK